MIDVRLWPGWTLLAFVAGTFLCSFCTSRAPPWTLRRWVRHDEEHHNNSALGMLLWTAILISVRGFFHAVLAIYRSTLRGRESFVRILRSRVIVLLYLAFAFVSVGCVYFFLRSVELAGPLRTLMLTLIVEVLLTALTSFYPKKDILRDATSSKVVIGGGSVTPKGGSVPGGSVPGGSVPGDSVPVANNKNPTLPSSLGLHRSANSKRHVRIVTVVCAMLMVSLILMMWSSEPQSTMVVDDRMVSSTMSSSSSPLFYPSQVSLQSVVAGVIFFIGHSLLARLLFEVLVPRLLYEHLEIYSAEHSILVQKPMDEEQIKRCDPLRRDSISFLSKISEHVEHVLECGLFASALVSGVVVVFLQVSVVFLDDTSSSNGTDATSPPRYFVSHMFWTVIVPIAISLLLFVCPPPFLLSRLFVFSSKKDSIFDTNSLENHNRTWLQVCGALFLALFAHGMLPFFIHIHRGTSEVLLEHVLLGVSLLLISGASLLINPSSEEKRDEREAVVGTRPVTVRSLLEYGEKRLHLPLSSLALDHNDAVIKYLLQSTTLLNPKHSLCTDVTAASSAPQEVAECSNHHPSSSPYSLVNGDSNEKKRRKETDKYFSFSSANSNLHHQQPHEDGIFPILLHMLETCWRQPKQRKLLIFLVMTLSFMLVEFFYGLHANSLGLVSDSFHMLLDSASIAAGLYASVLSQWSRNSDFPFGYGRYEFLSGFVNSVLLVCISVYIFQEAIERIAEPPEISTEYLLFVSVGGLVVNIVGVVFFHEAHHAACSHHHHHHHHRDEEEDDCKNAEKRVVVESTPPLNNHSSCDGGHDHHNSHSHMVHDLNLRGVYLHILADLLGSMSVITSSFVVTWTGWHVADPICSAIIALFILFSAIPLMKQTGALLMLQLPHHLVDNVEGCSTYLSGAIREKLQSDVLPRSIRKSTPSCFDFSPFDVEVLVWTVRNTPQPQFAVHIHIQELKQTFRNDHPHRRNVPSTTEMLQYHSATVDGCSELSSSMPSSESEVRLMVKAALRRFHLMPAEDHLLAIQVTLQS